MSHLPHSVIIPVYNGSKKLAASIDCILNQSFKDFELIIIDDGSIDNTRNIINQYAAKDSRIRPIFLESNRGINAVMELGIRQAYGEYLSFLGVGDYYSNIQLEVAHNSFKQYPKAVIWCGIVDLFYDKTQIELNKSGSVVKTQFISKQEIVRFFKNTPFWVPGTSTVVKRSTLIDHLANYGFPHCCGPQSDWFLFHSIALREGICHSPISLAMIELHEDSYSSKSAANRTKYRTQYLTIIEYLYKKQNKINRSNFIRSGLLTNISNALFWKLIRNPKYWPILFHSKSSTTKRIFKSLKKSLLLQRKSNFIVAE